MQYTKLTVFFIICDEIIKKIYQSIVYTNKTNKKKNYQILLILMLYRLAIKMMKIIFAI